MTGDNVKKLFDDLHMSVRGACSLLGITPNVFHNMVGYLHRDFDTGTPIEPLALNILGRLWSHVSDTYDTKTVQGREGARLYGEMLAKAMHIHGYAYAVWLILDTVCSRTFAEEMLAMEETSAPR